MLVEVKVHCCLKLANTMHTLHVGEFTSSMPARSVASWSIFVVFYRVIVQKILASQIESLTSLGSRVVKVAMFQIQVETNA